MRRTGGIWLGVLGLAVGAFAQVLVSASAAQAGPPWPASADRMAAPAASLDRPAIAAAADGRLIVALTRFSASSGFSVEILRSDTEATQFSTLGHFWNPDPLLEYSHPDVAILEDAGTIIVSMLEQLSTGLRVTVARTPLDGPPQWTSTTAVTGLDLREPILLAREEPGESPELHVLVQKHAIAAASAKEEPRALSVAEQVPVPEPEPDRRFDDRLLHVRSLDGGRTWSAPATIDEASYPSEISSVGIAAGRGSRLHVAYRRGEPGECALVYARHPDRGDPGVPWDSPQVLVDRSAGILDCDVAAAGDTAEVWVVHQRRLGDVCVAWSPDGGDTFPSVDIELMGEHNQADALRVLAFEGEAHLVFRFQELRLLYRSWPLDEPETSGFASLVSDTAQPPCVPFDLTARPGAGPAVTWLRDEGQLRSAWVDAFWFPPTAGVAEGGESPGGAGGAGATPGTPSLVVRAAPNPFSRSLEIAFGAVPAPAAEVRIHDALGRVRRRLPALVAAGSRGDSSGWQVSWDGRDERGVDLPAGVYFATVRAGGASATVRVVRLP